MGLPQILDTPVTPANNVPQLLAELRVPIPGGWDTDAEVGDVLQAIASYTVIAGVNTDFSRPRAPPWWCPEADKFGGGPLGPPQLLMSCGGEPLSGTGTRASARSWRSRAAWSSLRSTSSA